MRYTARQLKEVFDAQIPTTDNAEAYRLFEMLRDRLFSTAYRLMRDLPDGSSIGPMIASLCDAQRHGNSVILDSFKKD